MIHVRTCTETSLNWADFTAFIVKRRNELGITQSMLAEAIGRKQPDVSAIENGRTEPTVETICKLAEALEVPPLSLLGKILKK